MNWEYPPVQSVQGKLRKYVTKFGKFIHVNFQQLLKKFKEYLPQTGVVLTFLNLIYFKKSNKA